MKRLSKPAMLAAGLAAALMMSTSLASAAEHGHRGFQQVGARHDDGRGQSRSDARKDSRGARHSDKDHKTFAHRGRRAIHPAYDRKRFADRYHRPPQLFERAGYAPRPGVHWRAGYWRWHDGQWAWIVGAWLIAAEAAHH